MNFPGKLFLGNLVERRALLYQMVRRDFEQRYVGSAAGWLWGLIHPAVMMICWTFVFQICAKIEMPRGEVNQNYTLFLLAGYLPWLLFNETIQRSSTSLVENANLITKTLFPSEMIPISVFCSSLVSHLMTLVILLIAVVVVHGYFPWTLALVPLYILCTGLFAVGIGWVISSLQVYLRDAAQAMNVVMQLWFWLTPIFVFETTYPERLRFLLDYNPMAFLVRAYRDVILPGRSFDPDELFILMGWSIAAFMIGGLTFRHLKRGFADVL